MSRGLVLSCMAVWVAVNGFAVQRFPPPEFDSGYSIPTVTEPAARGEWLAFLDVAVLVAALGLAAWLSLKKRSRKGIVALMVFSLLYFGFWRRGCICPIGAIGNVTYALFDHAYAIPWFVTAFFFLPIAAAIFFGRSFCAGVCPLGALQDIVLLKPIRIPVWLESSLRLAAWLYLSLAVLYAALGSAFIICRYDPLVAFFRFTASPTMWTVSILTLALALFVGRPYCRFLCPLGIILRQVSRISRQQVTITPDECIHCRLCEDACPFGAIQKPTEEWPTSEHAPGSRRLLLYILLLPVLIAGGAALGYLAHPKLAALDPAVELAGEVRQFQNEQGHRMSDEVQAFQASGISMEHVYREADDKVHQFAIGASLAGGWMGLVAGGSLILNSVFWRRHSYEPHRSGCLACGRCFNACPHHRMQNRIKAEKIMEAGIRGS
ncbi:MAG: 4Fe-4S binding protein [Planctomycetaceae bacterium]|nr:4Fe-4S binding protein [Planctomycetaceae bacterium]